jgi:hypothetical protein
VALGAPQVVPGFGVDPVWTELDAPAALDALGLIAPHPVFAQGGPKPGRSVDYFPGLTLGQGVEGYDFFCFGHGFLLAVSSQISGVSYPLNFFNRKPKTP